MRPMTLMSFQNSQPPSPTLSAQMAAAAIGEGHDERERGDDDLEREERLEAEHRPVAPFVHALSEEQQDERQQISPG